MLVLTDFISRRSLLFHLEVFGFCLNAFVYSIDWLR